MTKFRYMNIICNGLWSWEQKLTAMNYENGILLVVSSEVSVNFILLFFFIIYYWIQWHWFGIVALIFLYCGAYILYRLDTGLKLFCFGFQFGGWLSLKWGRLSLLWRRLSSQMRTAFPASCFDREIRTMRDLVTII